MNNREPLVKSVVVAPEADTGKVISLLEEGEAMVIFYISVGLKLLTLDTIVIAVYVAFSSLISIILISYDKFWLNQHRLL
ncbi:MAG TPA: hypothetical protein VHF65_01710 [Nitrososphaera sp.]|nr:hypothetical protein [Nitrososphaera sp.]